MAEYVITTTNSPEGGLGTIEKTFTYSLLYLSPQIKVRKELGFWIPYLFIGPRFDFLLASPSEFPECNGSILGVDVGCGFDFLIGPVGLGTRIHYQGDLTPLYRKKSRDGSNYSLTIRNTAVVLDLTLKYYF